MMCSSHPNHVEVKPLPKARGGVVVRLQFCGLFVLCLLSLPVQVVVAPVALVIWIVTGRSWCLTSHIAARAAKLLEDPC